MARLFLKITAVLLGLTGIAKLWSLNGSYKLLQSSDPILGLTFGSLLLLAAGFELSVAAICLARPAIEGLVLVAWLSAVLLAYRISLWWIGWQKPCACLGNLTDALHISPQLADNAMKGLLAFMLIGSVTLLVWERRRDRVSCSIEATTNPLTSS